jgi:hypothetical protein
MSTGINIAPSSDLTVGTTAVTSGTNGRVFFQAGGVVQQSDRFTFDNTTATNILQLGAGANLGVSLRTIAPGGTSSDIAFRVRNFADNADIFKIQGNTNVIFGGTGADYLSIIGGANWGTDCYFNFSSGNYIRYLGQNGDISIFTNSSLRSRGTYIGGATQLVYFDNGGNIRIGQGFSGSNQPDVNATRTIQQMTGVAPTTSVADGFQQYSADRGGVAGKASAHFRTEDGTINVLGDLSGIGTASPGARLDVRAQGALSTDIAFRVRNSADTADIFSVNGNGVFYKPHASTNNDVAQDVFVSQMSDGRNKIRMFTKGSFNVSSAIGISFQSDAAGGSISSYTLTGAFLNTGATFQDNSGLSVFNVGTSNVTGYSFLRLKNNLGTQDNIYISRTGTIILNPDNANAQIRGLSIFGGTLGATADRVISIGNGTAPTTSPADAIQFYSNDITAGNAAPHFRTENGAIVKVYQETTGVGASTLVTGVGTPLTDTDTFDGYTLKQIVKALRNQGLLA